VERPLDLARDTDQQVLKAHRVVHLALLPQAVVQVADTILILAQDPELEEAVEVDLVMDMLADFVQVLLVP
jgi:hypothetical protein